MKSSDKFEIADILARKATNIISQTEQGILDEWLAESEVHRDMFEKFMSGESLLERNRRFAHLDPEAMIKSVERRYLSAKKRKAFIRWSAAAAVFIALVSLSLFILSDGRNDTPADQIYADRGPAMLILDDGTQITLSTVEDGNLAVGTDAEILFDGELPTYNVSDEGAPENYNTIMVPQGGIYRIKLPDGSLAVINANSKLRYPVPFPKDLREVWLDGEAYFEVAHNPDKPFIVNFKENKLRVLGTSFNISAYPLKASNATLVEGSVLCWTSADSCVLTPGYRAVIEENTPVISVERADLRSVMSWTRERFSFNNEPLESIMAELGEWYDIEVVFDDPALKTRIFTVEMTRYASFNDIMHILEETGKIRYLLDGRKLTIRNK